MRVEDSCESLLLRILIYILIIYSSAQKTHGAKAYYVEHGPTSVMSTRNRYLTHDLIKGLRSLARTMANSMAPYAALCAHQIGGRSLSSHQTNNNPLALCRRILWVCFLVLPIIAVFTVSN